MANANLLNANQAYVDQQNFDVGSEITGQFDKIMAAKEAYDAKLNEDAVTASENLSADAIGYDLMSKPAQQVLSSDLALLGVNIAKARASGNKKLVRELETQGADLIAMQREIGNLLKDHAENKLSGSYSNSADQNMLDLLINEDYTLKKDDDGKYRIMFTSSRDLTLTPDPTFNNKTLPFGQPNQMKIWQKRMDKAVAEGDENNIKKLNLEKERKEGKGYETDWQAEGVLLSDLDRHIRIKDDGQSETFNTQLKKIQTNSNENKNYNIVKAETERIVTDIVDTTDRLQTALFDNPFSQDNKTLAQIYAKEFNLNEREAFEILKSSGKDYFENEDKVRQWTERKLNQAAQNYHNISSPSYGELTNTEKSDKNTMYTLDNFFNALDNKNGDIEKVDLNLLNNATTRFKVIEDKKDGSLKYVVDKWSNGMWVSKNTNDEKNGSDGWAIDMDRNRLRQIFAEELGMSSATNYSSNLLPLPKSF